MFNEDNIKVLASRIEREMDGLLKSHVPQGFLAGVVESELMRLLTDDCMNQLKDTIDNLPFLKISRNLCDVLDNQPHEIR